MIWLGAFVAVMLLVLIAMAIQDLVQTRHAIRRNFPVIGRLRYRLESIGPELRQYIVTSDDEELPFSRDQRRWVYATAKQENPYFGFGTDTPLSKPQNYFIRHAAFPYVPSTDDDQSHIPCAKVVGQWRGRREAFRPASVVNISAMSFGSLSGPAVEAINRGSKIAGCMQNTGEGGLSVHHRHGGDLIFQIGTGYFGCRTPEGRFDLDKLVDLVAGAPIRMIEIKLSQGAKPGLGGVLPAKKVTPAIAEARGVPQGQSVLSPSSHREFDDVDGLIDFVERIADATGLPVGIKAAVGQLDFWFELADRMAARQQGPDFIAIDGGEGGTGAAPLTFSDHVALPFREAFPQVYKIFAEQGLNDHVVWCGAGKLGFGGEALLAMAMGVDLVYVAREAMLAIGCIQAKRCHNNHCPAGVATQDRWLIRGLDPDSKGARLGNYVVGLRHDLLRLTHACGASHPALVGGRAVELPTGPSVSVDLWTHFDYDDRWVPFGPQHPQRQVVADLMG